MDRPRTHATAGACYLRLVRFLSDARPKQAARADFEKSVPLGREALGSNVHLRMEFPSGLCDKSAIFYGTGPFSSSIPPFRPTATCRKACMYAQKPT